MVGDYLKAMTVIIQSSAQYVANEENEAQQSLSGYGSKNELQNWEFGRPLGV